ncbi:uncharacterized protein LOC62_02G003411 [Vanrija pseudolonga]|uniref:Uncharacterized protein n=1 Tax=Vanrija pseudolonga TaxID=143232 RepID=A0AAF0YA97_9TREE|nr:hypothetical protein LOC62_02G003411 [Vanrija pseudolonga]
MDDKGSTSSGSSPETTSPQSSWWRRFSTSSPTSPPPVPLHALSLPTPPLASDTHDAKIAYLVGRGYAARAAAKQLAAHDGDLARAEGRLAHKLHLKGVQPTLRRQGCPVCDERRRGKQSGVGMSIREWKAAEAEAEAEAASDSDGDDDLPVYAEDDYAPAYVVHKADTLCALSSARERPADERDDRIARLEAMLAFYAPQLGDVARVSTAALVVPRNKEA